MKQTFYLIVLTILIFGCSGDNSDEIEEFEFEHKEAVDGFSTSDVELFWKAYDFIRPNFNKIKFQNIYIDNGSAGLKDYALQKQLASGLEKVFQYEAYRDYYESIRENTQDLDQVIKKTKDAFKRFQTIYPELQIFDVYFLIGALGAGGRVSDNGLLIAVEMCAKTDASPITGLHEQHQNVIKTKDYLPALIVHELVHKQEKIKPKNANYRTLLEQSILEGMADFVTSYILPEERFINQRLHDFGNEREQELWNEFKPDLDKNYRETEWFYTGQTTSKGYPADMGYYVGYKICEAYASKFDTVEEAINQMLNETDYDRVYELSGYKEKFQ